MNLETAIKALLQNKDLTQLEAETVFTQLLRGKLRFEESKTLLVLLARKGESLSEVLGCLSAIRKLEPYIAFSTPHLMDTCGTGGDGSHSFNISTLTAFVIAGAGGKVAKHGNRAISSNTGSSDLMRALGVNLEASKQTMMGAIKQFGIGYFHAPYYHPIFKRVQPLRQTLKIRTIFNLLGPLLNPFKLKAQLVGVANTDLLKLYTNILKTQSISALVCHSTAGMDELTSFKESKVSLIRNKHSSSKIISPKTYGFSKGTKKDLLGGNARENKKIALSILNNELEGPLRETILLNAGAGLWISGITKDLKQGISKAQNSIESKSAFKVLQELKRFSKAK